MSEPVYDVNYFIAKFEAIPDELWCCGNFTNGNKHCAIGHCQSPFEGAALFTLFRSTGMAPTRLNDGEYQGYDQLTPRARILSALNDIKAKS